MVNTRFWSDTFVSDLDSLEKLLFLYLITNQYTNICGIYEIPLKQIALDTGIDKDNLQNVLLPRFKKYGKIYYINGWIYVKNFLKHQKSSGNVKLGIENGLNLVPKQIMAKIKEIENTPPSDLDTASNFNLNFNLNSIADKSAKDENLIPIGKKKEIWNWNSKLKEILNDSRRHIHIIGLMWNFKGTEFGNKEQYQAQLHRHLQSAKKLIGYKDNVILWGMKEADKHSKQDTEYKWTLETVLKML